MSDAAAPAFSLQTSPLFDSIPDKEIVSLQRQGSYSDKVRSLIEAFLSTTQTQFPGLADANYDFATGQYTGRDNLPVDGRYFDRAAASASGRTSRAGKATLRRAVFLKSLLAEASRPESRVLEHIQSRRDSLGEGGHTMQKRPGDYSHLHPDVRARVEARGKIIAVTKAREAAHAKEMGVKTFG